MKKTVSALALIISILLCGCGRGEPSPTDSTTATSASSSASDTSSGSISTTEATSAATSGSSQSITHTVVLYDMRGGGEKTQGYSYSDELDPVTLMGALEDFLGLDLAVNWIELAEDIARIDLAHSGAIGSVASASDVTGLLDSVRATFCDGYGRSLHIYFTVDGADTVLFGTELSSSVPYTGGGDYSEQEGAVSREDACGYTVNLASGMLGIDPELLSASYEGQMVIKSFHCYIISVYQSDELKARFAVSLDGSNVYIQKEDGSYGYY
ncbi:MAG: hypothetical protein IKM04_03450 [Clostridia bacterium]|nr:hypothetical protein [Clostridia bacterium]